MQQIIFDSQQQSAKNLLAPIQEVFATFLQDPTERFLLSLAQIRKGGPRGLMVEQIGPFHKKSMTTLDLID